MNGPVVVLNAGSSSLKFTVLENEVTVLRGMVDRIGVPPAPCHVSAKDSSGSVLLDQDLEAKNQKGVLDWLLAWAPGVLGNKRPVAAGHRVVHGGDRFTAPVRVTPQVLDQLDALAPLAPLHQPHNVLPIRHLWERNPDVPQVACFDTAFHATQPRMERLFGLPRTYFEKGFKRYGFHGLSYEFIATRLPAIDPKAAEGRSIACHLGNGASLCAMLGGKSQATTMTFSPTDGLLMGTRCGAIDPMLVLQLVEQHGMDTKAVSNLLNKESGLVGISGIGSDMRDLLASSAPEADEAVDFFCHRIAREIGALSAVLSGLDCLVFTGGIGENSADVRLKVCQLSKWLGIEIDASANKSRATRISLPSSRVTVLVVPTNEELMIARHTLALI
jgi:acetate kinase